MALGRIEAADIVVLAGLMIFLLGVYYVFGLGGALMALGIMLAYFAS